MTDFVDPLEEPFDQDRFGGLPAEFEEVLLEKENSEDITTGGDEAEDEDSTD